jgi:hypothetical protein
MPYPESCPECAGAFRNSGTHFTSRRNEIGRHVLLELGCQNTSRRFWWDFTTGSLTEDGRTVPARRNAALRAETNGHATGVSTLERAEAVGEAEAEADTVAVVVPGPVLAADNVILHDADAPLRELSAQDSAWANDAPSALEAPVADGALTPALSQRERAFEPALPQREKEFEPVQTNREFDAKEAFVRQLQLDRLTLRQMRSWLMSDEARRAIEVAAGATEATYERLALILFGSDLPQLLGKQVAAPTNPGMSAEERLELQREKARIRARLRRAAAKAAKQS